MRTIWASRRAEYRWVAALLVGLLCQGTASAASGVWIDSDGDGLWSAGGNWQGGTIADGAGFTADFSQVNVDAVAVNNNFPGFFRNAVNLDGPRTIGNIIFGDSNLASGGAWEIYTENLPGNILTLAGTTPTITVNTLTPFDTGSGIIDDAIIRPSVAGTSGLTKAGPGILTLGGGTTNTFTGGINVNQGTLRLQAAVPAQLVTLANGTTFETVGNHNSGVSIAEGGTVTYTYTGTGAGSASNVNAPGSTATLNLNILNNTTLSPGGAWTGFQNINVTGQSTAGVSFLRVSPNPTGGPVFFDTNSFANTNLHLDNTQLLVRTNSQGNTIPIGRLTGTATGELAGGNAGTAARYELGGLNNTYTYAGRIVGQGGVSINKVGTGTITFSGEIVGGAANGSLAIDSIPARQGGVFRVTSGTLAVTGQTSIPGGPAANPTILTTIDILPDATFDVSDAPGTFTTSAQQKVQGGGRVLGNYSHPAGFIRPGDVGAPTADNEGNLSAGVTPTPGTITFDGDLALSGGTIVSDTALSPASGNDLVHVTGQTTISGGRILPNFLDGLPAAGLTYTVLTSDGGIMGNANTMTVDYPGRTADPMPFVEGNSLKFTTVNPTPAANLIWTGNNGGIWDIQTTQAWTNGGSPDVFFDLDVVTFNETATNKNVSVAAVVTPGAPTITINNTSDYMFTGTGAIAGSAGLTKTGSGNLTMQLNNTFNGPVSISDGATVNIGNTNGLGTGPLTLNNATLIRTTGSFANSEIIIPAGTTNTIQANEGGDLGGAANLIALSGGGTLNLTSTIDNKAFATGVTSNFTGTLNIQPSGTAVLLSAVRVRGGQTTFPGAVVNVTAARISNQQGAAAGTMATIEFGELHGDASSGLVAFEGGSTPPHANWQIGALNTSSNFDGIIADNAAMNPTSQSIVTKVGTGTLTLSGANTYTGATVVQAGTLRTTNSSVLPDATNVLLSTGAMLNLDFSGQDAVNALFFNGVPQVAGTWGAMGSGATNVNNVFFSGGGVLNVAQQIALGLIGDYNQDNKVDAADYVVWRNSVGAATLPNRDPANPGTVGPLDYNSWRARFGQMAGSGSEGGGAVPEPASWMLLAVALAAGCCCRRRA